MDPWEHLDVKVSEAVVSIEHSLARTPSAPIPHAQLPKLDPNRPPSTTKPATDITDGTCGGEDRQYKDPRVTKTLKLLYSIQGHVTDEQIIKNLTADPVARGDIQLELQNLRSTVGRFQSRNCGRSSWFLTWLESEIHWENFFILLYNAKRLTTKLGRRRRGTTDAQHAANLAAKFSLETEAAEAKSRTINGVEREIAGIKDGSISVFRVGERRLDAKSPKMRELIERDVRRLEGLIADLTAHPESKFPEGALADDQTDSSLLGDRMKAVAQRDTAGRKEFYTRIGKTIPILMSANRGTADAFDFVASIENSRPFRVFEMQHFLHSCDTAFVFLIKAIMFNKVMELSTELRIRQFVADASSPEYQAYFATIRAYHTKYNSTPSLRRHQPPIGLEHILVDSEDTMDEKTSLKRSHDQANQDGAADA